MKYLFRFNMYLLIQLYCGHIYKLLLYKLNKIENYI